MPDKDTLRRAKRDKRQGKSPTTQAGEFVREEIHHIREGKHGARSARQAIAIGLSKARRAGVDLPPPEKGETADETREQAKRDLSRGRRGSSRKPSAKRSRAAREALKDEKKSVASKKALSEHARKAARKRTPAERSASARKGVHKRNAEERSASAKKAARTRARKG